MPSKISIILVVYNAAGLLEKTLNSIFRQDYPGVELVVIDGASTDGTVEIIKRNSDRITFWRSEPDRGIYDAMNKGLKAATGEYVLFINAGDQLYEVNTLSKVMQHAPRADIIYGRTMLIDSYGNELGERRLKPPLQLQYKSFLRGMLVSHQAFVARKTVTGLYDLRFSISSDIDWCIRAMQASRVIVNSHVFIARYLVGGLSRQRTGVAWKERFSVMVKNYGFIPTLAAHAFIAVRFMAYFSKSRRLD